MIPEGIIVGSSTKSLVFLGFSEALHSGYEDGQNPLLYGLLNMSGLV